MTANFLALCAELLEVADRLYKQSATQPHNQVIELSNGRHAIPIGMDVMTQDGVIGNLLNRFRAALAAAPPEPVGEGLRLCWTESLPPNESCRYDHCIAETPFGRFLITWKSWKEYDSPTVDETPWGDWYGAFDCIDKAKSACQQEFDQRLARCGRSAPLEPVGEGEELAQWLEHLADLRRLNHHVRPSASALTRTATLIRQLAARAAALQRPAPGEGPDQVREALRKLCDAILNQFFGNDTELPKELIQATNEAQMILAQQQHYPVRLTIKPSPELIEELNMQPGVVKRLPIDKPFAPGEGGLTDEELDDIADETPLHGSPRQFWRNVARAAIAADRQRRAQPPQGGEVG